MSDPTKLFCHFDDCNNEADFSILDMSCIFNVDICCSNCIPKILHPSHRYIIEPWNMELSDSLIRKLIRGSMLIA